MARRKAGRPAAWLGKAAVLTAEAQSVIALRLVCLSRGGKRAHTEAARMFIEKYTAFLAAQAAAASALPFGGLPLAADTVINTYRRSVRANRRRLSRRSAR
jgi:hypothetical protein